MTSDKIFLLSVIEITSVMLIFIGLEPKIKTHKFFCGLIIFSIASITTLTDYFQLSYGTIINFALFILLSILLFKFEILSTIFQFIICFTIFSSIQLFLMLVLNLLSVSISYSFFNGIIISSLSFLLSFLIYKFIPLYRISRIYTTYKKIINLILINIFILLLAILYLWETKKEFTLNELPLMAFAFISWGMINIILSFQIIKNREQQKVIQLHNEYIPVVEGLISDVRQIQHDFKNHLHTMYGMIEISEEHQLRQDLRTYMDSIIERIQPTDTLLKLKDNILSSIIYSKKCVADRNELDFSYEFLNEIPEYPLKKYELVELIGNLLDNAFEAVLSLGDKERKILLKLGTVDNTKIIEVRNTFKTEDSDFIEHIFQKGFSTKKGKNRGYGLYNVKSIVENYHGKIEVSFESDNITIKILF